MAIDVKNTGLDVKLESSKRGTSSSDLNWEDTPDGKYLAEMVIVYPWKAVTHKTTQRVKDADGKYVKDADGNFEKEDIGEITWNITDAVFKVKDPVYDGHAVKGTFSTHPDMIGSIKKFLYNANLFDVELKDLYKKTGTEVMIHVKHKVQSYKDKTTGMMIDANTPYVSYYDRVASSDAKDTKNDSGI